MGYQKIKLDCVSVCSDARSRGKLRHRANLVILRDKNSVLILCIIPVAVFFFFFLARVVSEAQGKFNWGQCYQMSMDEWKDPNAIRSPWKSQRRPLLLDTHGQVENIEHLKGWIPAWLFPSNRDLVVWFRCRHKIVIRKTWNTHSAKIS